MPHGAIVSHTLGRMRVRLHHAHRDATAMETLEDRLSEHPAIASVETNPRTGSVLLQYDHHRLTRDDLADVLWDAGLVARELLGADEIPEDLGREAEAAPHSTTATILVGMAALLAAERYLV